LQGERVATRVRHVVDDVGTADVFIESLTPRQRWLRAVKMGGICWGLALLSVLVPVLHFVLVPGFLLAGPIAAWLAWRRTESLLGGEVDCPKCGQTYDVGTGGVQWPLQAQCDGCRTTVRLHRGSGIDT